MTIQADGRFVSEIPRTVLGKDPDIFLFRLHHKFGKHIPTVFSPLADNTTDIGKAANGCKNLAKLVGAPPGRIKSASPSSVTFFSRAAQPRRADSAKETSSQPSFTHRAIP
jgi:hypothetical protein